LGEGKGRQGKVDEDEDGSPRLLFLIYITKGLCTVANPSLHSCVLACLRACVLACWRAGVLACWRADCWTWWLGVRDAYQGVVPL
jgi:hypothetical protein